MDKRQIVGAMAGPILGLGATIALATLRPEVAPYVSPLRLVAMGLMAFAVGLWACLFLTAQKLQDEHSRKRERGYVPIDEAAVWFYSKASPAFRNVMASFTPDTFDNVSQVAVTYIREAATTKDVALFARRGVSLPLERVEPQELKESAFEEMFSPEQPPHIDLSIKRSDLPKVLAHWEAAVRDASAR